MVTHPRDAELGQGCPTPLSGLTELAQEDSGRKFSSIAHFLAPEALYEAFGRIYIPKEDGKQRAISIPALEDKIVQKATVRLLNAIYESDFLACSYGSRPGRNPHQALDEVDRMLFRESIAYVLEIDIVSYFDAIVREHLMEMIERRISDTSILRLIRKW